MLRNKCSQRCFQTSFLDITEKRGLDHGDDTDGSEEDEDESRQEAEMSNGHKAGLAKVKSVIEWLSHVLRPEKAAR